MRRFCSLRSYSQFCIRIRNSQFRGLPAPTVLIFTVPVASSSAESLLCFITRPQIAQKCHKPANYPHKLTKTAEPWLGGGAALSGSELHAGVTSAALRSSRCALVAAAAAPPEGGRHGGRSLQLRVIALARRGKLFLAGGPYDRYREVVQRSERLRIHNRRKWRRRVRSLLRDSEQRFPQSAGRRPCHVRCCPRPQGTAGTERRARR